MAIYEIFEQIGEPSHIFTDMDTCHTEDVCDYWYHVSLIYVDQGIILNWSESHLKKGTEILGFTANQNDFELIFEEPSQTQQFINANQQPNVQPWQGFSTSFKDYCKDRGCSGFFGHQPSTATPPASIPSPTP